MKFFCRFGTRYKSILGIYILKALLKHNPCIFWIQRTPSLHFCNLFLVKWMWELQIVDPQDQVYPAIQRFHYKIQTLLFCRRNTNLCVLDTLSFSRNISNPSLKFDKFSQVTILIKTLKSVHFGNTITLILSQGLLYKWTEH